MLAKDELLQGRYRIVRQLGHGGMGAVYEAKDERLGSSVALKEVIIEIDRLLTANQQEIFRRAFEREARLLASLHHEAFPRVTDYFSEEDRQFLIMELITGDDLGERLNKNQKSFPFENIVKWAEQLLDALDYLHTQDPPTFHRDIKPQNLKVTSRGKIKLLDFGIARSVDKSGSTVTNQTFVGATLNYSPIEQTLPAIPETFREFIVWKYEKEAKIVLNQNTDARCDLYAVGATIYHLLTNHPPTESTKRSLKVWEGNPDPLPNPSELNPEIPVEFSEWLLKAMEIDRENRFSSAIEMQKALQKFVADEKAKKRAAEKAAMLPVQPPLQNRETINQQQFLTQDHTARLITADNIKYEQKDEFISPPAPTELSIKPVFDTYSPNAPTITDSNFIQTPNTASINLSTADLTATPYFDEKLLVENKPEPVAAVPYSSQPVVAMPYISQPSPPVSFTATNAAERIDKKPMSMLFWLLPIAAFGILTISGIGGVIWLKSSSNAIDSTKPIANANANANVSTTPTATLSITSNTPSTSPTKTDSEKQPEKSKPPVAATPNKTPVQNPVKNQPPKPATPKPAQDPNCVFTNSCK